MVLGVWQVVARGRGGGGLLGGGGRAWHISLLRNLSVG